MIGGARRVQEGGDRSNASVFSHAENSGGRQQPGVPADAGSATALLMRAVALKQTDLTDFVLHHAVRAAKAPIEQADHGADGSTIARKIASEPPALTTTPRASPGQTPSPPAS